MTTHAFRDIVVGARGRARRPVVDVVVDGVELAPQACLIDTGAGAIRMSAEIADALGIELADDEPTRISVGGTTVDARQAIVSLAITIDDQVIRWETPVWFCDPWWPAFGLLGLRGFLDCFDLELSGSDETFALTSRLSA